MLKSGMNLLPSLRAEKSHIAARETRDLYVGVGCDMPTSSFEARALPFAPQDEVAIELVPSTLIPGAQAASSARSSRWLRRGSNTTGAA
jgi:hypothetical protein